MSGHGYHSGPYIAKFDHRNEQMKPLIMESEVQEYKSVDIKFPCGNHIKVEVTLC